VHLQIEIPPNLPIAAVVQRIKSESSALLKKKVQIHRQKCISTAASASYLVSTLETNTDADAAVEIHFVDEFELFLEKSARLGLDPLHDGSDREVWRYLDLKVHMIVVGVERVYVERGVFLGGFV